MSKKKIYIITKDKYEGSHRTIGFVRDMGKHIYYDFLSHNVQLRTKKMEAIIHTMKMAVFGEQVKE